MKDIVILYHAECPDGFGAAWAAWKKFGDKAEYVAAHHDRPVPVEFNDKEVYMLDFSYPQEVMKEIIKKAKRVTAIDHHVSREASIKMTEDYQYSIDNSGSVLAWRYFHKDGQVPKLLSYIEDRDLYKFGLPKSREICAFIDSFDYDFNIWNKLADELEDEVKIKLAIDRGGIVVTYEKELVQRLIDDNAKLVKFEGYEIFSVNAPNGFSSDIGAILYKNKPPMVIIWRQEKESVAVSLRSDGTVDVSKIAAKYGGGGHKASAGFYLPSINSFPWQDKKS